MAPHTKASGCLWHGKIVNGKLFTQSACSTLELSGLRTRLYVYVHRGSNWNFKMLVFEGRQKPEYLEKKILEQGENEQ